MGEELVEPEVQAAEAEAVDVEAAHAVDVRGAKVDVADGDARIDRAWAGGDRGNVALRTLR